MWLSKTGPVGVWALGHMGASDSDVGWNWLRGQGREDTVGGREGREDTAREGSPAAIVIPGGEARSGSQTRNPAAPRRRRNTGGPKQDDTRTPGSRQVRALARRWVSGLRCASPGMTIAGGGAQGGPELSAKSAEKLPSRPSLRAGYAQLACGLHRAWSGRGRAGLSKTGGGPGSAGVYFTGARTRAEKKNLAEGREGRFGGRKGTEDRGREGSPQRPRTGWSMKAASRP